MPVDRPTFSESWYRVCELRPRLRSTVQVHRQHYRGQMWHVLQDPGSNQYFRLSDPGYRFIGLLDGHRTVAEAWQICNEQFGDYAVTQGEAIQLLGQLYAGNLIQAELPPDAATLFQRYRKRVRREVQSYLMNLLFIRIPLYDPDAFLERWVSVFGKIFTWPALIVWAAMVGTGLYFLAGHFGELANRAQGVLDMENIPLLYLSFALIKIVHEFSHSFACKRFGQDEGTGGEVHTIGIMFLVFTPLPYMDASSAWAFQKKWHRVIVGAAGILVELAIASVAAIVWVKTGEGSVAHAIAYNVMFIASVSTLIFNGNPLLRFDAYYILSDLIEIPNLAQRSKQYIYYLVKRYVWRVRNPQNPAHTRGEKAWFVFYGIASTLYRVFICIRILLFVAGKFFLIGAALAIAAVVGWVLVPLGRFLHYLASSPELMRVRGRAVATVAAVLVLVVVGVGLIPTSDRARVEGVVEPGTLAIIHAGEEGFVVPGGFTPSGTYVTPDGPPLIEARNDELEAQLRQLEAQRKSLTFQRRAAELQDPVAAQIYAKRVASVDDQIARTRQQLAELRVQAPFEGEWISDQVERLQGSYIHKGDRLGMVAGLGELIVRSPAGQSEAAALLSGTSEGDRVEIRVKSRPDPLLTGRIVKYIAAGQKRLPSRALGYAAGGTIQTSASDQQGTLAAEQFFEIHVRPDDSEKVRLLPGQRVVVRFDMPAKPLAAQWYRDLLQLIQQRFHI